MSKIVVFGGSFNPPTLAHEKLLTAAMDGVGADRGIFVPSNAAYVTKKMSKTDYPSEVLPERTRSAMLQAICEADSRLTVDEGEYNFSGTSGNSLDTMRRLYLQSQYAETEMLFLFGGDKLREFIRWKTWREFCESFKILVFQREGYDPEEEIEKTEVLREYRNSFVILPAPVGIGGISSTAVRDAVRRGDEETAKSMLRPEVFALLEGSPIRKETAITSFRGKYAFLSNFCAAEVTIDGMTYPTSEAAFQAMKCLDKEERIPFTETKNPVVVKRMGKQVKLRSDWEYVKVGIMEKIVRAKFTQNPELAEQLVATGDLAIMEGNTWRDTFWGVDAATGKGENHLGRILMKIREECGGAGDTSDSVSFPAAPKRMTTPSAPVSERRTTPSVSQPKGEEQREKPIMEPKPSAPESVYEPGMILRHPTFGEGTITAVSGKGNSRILDVEFPGVGMKRLGVVWVEKNCKS